jgi:hypothetical protein
MRIGKQLLSVAVVTAVIIGFVGATARAEEKAPPTTAPSAADPAQVIAPLAGLVGGEWRIKANWHDGTPLDARAVYTWGVGKKFIHAKTFVNAPEGEYQRYETVFGGEDGKLKAWQFAVDGHFTAMDFTVDGKKFSNSRTMPGAKAGDTLHQSLEIVEPNKLHWIVKFERDGKVQPLIEGDWIRDASASR